MVSWDRELARSHFFLFFLSPFCICSLFSIDALRQINICLHYFYVEFSFEFFFLTLSTEIRLQHQFTLPIAPTVPLIHSYEMIISRLLLLFSQKNKTTHTHKTKIPFKHNANGVATKLWEFFVRCNLFSNCFLLH